MCLSIEIERPDSVLNRGKHFGFEWIVVHNEIGYRCGYIRVPQDHPWYGKHYDEIDADVHGGLTFAEDDVPCGKGEDNGYWVGFDCAHVGDAPDFSLLVSERDKRKYHELTRRMRWVARTQEYVEHQCQLLCEQAYSAT